MLMPLSSAPVPRLLSCRQATISATLEKASRGTFSHRRVAARQDTRLHRACVAPRPALKGPQDPILHGIDQTADRRAKWISSRSDVLLAEVRDACWAGQDWIQVMPFRAGGKRSLSDILKVVSVTAVNIKSACSLHNLDTLRGQRKGVFRALTERPGSRVGPMRSRSNPIHVRCRVSVESCEHESGRSCAGWMTARVRWHRQSSSPELERPGCNAQTWAIVAHLGGHWRHPGRHHPPSGLTPVGPRYWYGLRVSGGTNRADPPRPRAGRPTEEPSGAICSYGNRLGICKLTGGWNRQDGM